MDRVFLDANVLFSAAYRPEAGLLALWRLERIERVTSDYALEEARRNLADPAQQQRLIQIAAALDLVGGTFEAVALPRGVRLPDDDLPILRAAIGSRCTHLLTGNLRDFGRYLGRRLGGVLVVRPAVYLARKRR